MNAIKPNTISLKMKLKLITSTEQHKVVHLYGIHRQLEFYSLFTIRIADRILWSVRYSNYRKYANKRKIKIQYKLPFLIERNSYKIKIITC